MSDKLMGVSDWEAVGECTRLDDGLRSLSPEYVLEVFGVERILATIGLRRVIECVGPERVLNALLEVMPAEQIQEILRRLQRDAHGDKDGEG